MNKKLKAALITLLILISCVIFCVIIIVFPKIALYFIFIPSIIGLYLSILKLIE